MQRKLAYTQSRSAATLVAYDWRLALAIIKLKLSVNATESAQYVQFYQDENQVLRRTNPLQQDEIFILKEANRLLQQQLAEVNQRLSTLLAPQRLFNHAYTQTDGTADIVSVAQTALNKHR